MIILRLQNIQRFKDRQLLIHLNWVQMIEKVLFGLDGLLDVVNLAVWDRRSAASD